MPAAFGGHFRLADRFAPGGTDSIVADRAAG
jgi:hypothetical protein